jgi:ATP-dependent Clp protease ATP-binding subunit ClpA
VIIIMTTNAGAERISRASIGFTTQDHSTDAGEVIKKAFSPEFRNRLDAIIHFNPLDRVTVSHVVDKFLVELETQLNEKNVNMEVDDDAREWLAENGHDPIMGARPMSRLIQEKVKRLLAEELLFGTLEHGGDVLVTVKNGELAVEIKTPAKDSQPA